MAFDIKLRDELLEVTRPGSLTQWVDRIGEFADKAGVTLHRVNWNNSPLLVAHEVVKLTNEDMANKLAELVKQARIEAEYAKLAGQAE